MDLKCIKNNIYVINPSIVHQYGSDIRGIIHIGGHIGQEYGCYKQNHINNLMFFEPLRNNYIRLIHNIGSECIVHNLALGNKNCEIDMYVEDKNDGMSCSILEPRHHLIEYPHITFDKKEKVFMKKLDHILFNRQNYNFINIDVQGYELEVFKGAINTLRNIDYIVTEISVKELYKDCVLENDLNDFLYDNGFIMQERILATETWGEALYIKNGGSR